MRIFSKPVPEQTVQASQTPQTCVGEKRLVDLNSSGAFKSDLCGVPATHLVRVNEQTYETIEQFAAQQPVASMTYVLPFCAEHGATYDQLLRDSRVFGRVPVEQYHAETQRLAQNMLDALVEVFDASDEDIARVVEYLNRQPLVLRLPPLRPRGQLRNL